MMDTDKMRLAAKGSNTLIEINIYLPNISTVGTLSQEENVECGPSRSMYNWVDCLRQGFLVSTDRQPLGGQADVKPRIYYKQGGKKAAGCQ